MKLKKNASKQLISNLLLTWDTWDFVMENPLLSAVEESGMFNHGVFGGREGDSFSEKKNSFLKVCFYNECCTL